MIKLYICCLVLIIGSVEVGPDIDMKFYQEVMEIVSYDISMIDSVVNDISLTQQINYHENLITCNYLKNELTMFKYKHAISQQCHLQKSEYKVYCRNDQSIML